MKLLPNFKNAVIPDEKISGYCLNTNHERGRHKAKVFRQVFGITKEDSELLKSVILEQLASTEIESEAENNYGKIFSLPMKISIFGKEGEVMTAWIIQNGTTIPRLTSCYVNK